MGPMISEGRKVTIPARLRINLGTVGIQVGRSADPRANLQKRALGERGQTGRVVVKLQ